MLGECWGHMLQVVGWLTVHTSRSLSVGACEVLCPLAAASSQGEDCIMECREILNFFWELLHSCFDYGGNQNKGSILFEWDYNI